MSSRKHRLPKKEYFQQRLAEITATAGWEDNPRLADKAEYYKRRLDEMEQPLLHQQTIKQLLRSMDEDAQAIADYAKDDGTYISASKVRTLVGNIQESIMHIQESIGHE
jgi:hypothetical protein